jgi:DNA-binding MarR family transcriptional regulator
VSPAASAGHRWGAEAARGTSVVRVIADTVSYALLRAVKANRARLNAVFAEHGLHSGQDLMLAALWQHDGVTQVELARRLEIEAPTVSRAVLRLERAGYVRREAGRGRARHIFLTDAGWALREPVERGWREADAELAGKLEPDELAALARIVTKLGARRHDDELAG